MTKIQSIRLLVSTSSAFLAIAPVVAAAEETPKAAAAEHDGRADILVVAEKRSAKLQDVPIQVSVLTGDALAARQITQTQDIAGTIPNMSVERNDTYRNTAIVIRSISQINNADSPVAVIVDGVPQNDQKQFGMRLFDIAQIEVLKGPQGSLYGRNAEGGAIIITTTAPTNELSGFADLSYGRGEMLAGSAGVSGALVPNKILFRLAGTYYKTDGLIRNTTRGDHADKVNHDWSLRGRLDFILSDSVKLDVRGQYGELNAKPQYWTIVGSGDANDFQLPFYAYPNRNFGKTSELTARFEADLGFATLTSISGYTRLTETQFADADFSPVQAVAVTQPFKNRLLSQEVRLVSPAGNAFRWLVSADYLNSKRAITTRVFVDTGDVANDPLNPALTIVSSAETSGRDAYGVSGQVDWDVLPGLTLTAGIRYDKDMRDQTNVATNIARSKSFEAWQPKLSASYKIDDRKLIYLTYGVGFRSGGFNPPNFATGIYNPEKLKNFEAGFKSQWFDKALTINGAVFTGIVTNYQFYYVDLATVSQVVGNIDRVRVTGAELEIRAIPAKGLNVFANFGMSDPTIKRLATFPQFVGNKTPRASKYSFSSGFDYTHQLSENLQAFLRADVQMISKKYWYTDNLDVQNAKTFVNGSIGINFDRSTLSLWGKNIFGEKAYESYYPTNLTGFPADIGWPNMPASYGVQFRAKF